MTYGYRIRVKYPNHTGFRYAARDEDGWHTTGWKKASIFSYKSGAEDIVEIFKKALTRFSAEVTLEVISSFDPDWASPPGATIKELLEMEKLSRSEFAYKMGLELVAVNELMNGSLEISHEMAKKLSSIIGGTTEFWVNREAQYREGVRKGLSVE